MAEEENIEENEERDEEFEQKESTEDAPEDNVVHVSGMYKTYFLDYASYVILERAVPAIQDGLKPVQRRILHSMKEMEDGRYNKVANVIGNTMKYHPHGDASIGDAMVQLGQKDLLIDCQGNWGNILTGDRAAAPRYIESRLTKFALEIVFNPKTTQWQQSYDGRNKEPITLPMKFPLLLAHGVEGIAVGMACKILPHNFRELIDACIAHLRGRSFQLVPDFPTAGTADFSQYNDGVRGGKVKVRARIAQEDKKKLIITEIPFGTTTTSLIDSILRANDRGKIKIKKVEDNTAETVEIIIHLAPNVSPDKMIDALYAFTDCEVSISPNSGVIDGNTPVFIGVKQLLKHSADSTVQLLKMELEIKRSELQEQWHFASLEKIFIENRIYRDIEEEETWEGVIAAIDKGIHKFISTPTRKNSQKKALKLHRDITEEDITRLTEIKIKRISKFDSFKADENIKKLEEAIAEVNHSLDNLIDFAVDYYKNLKKKYGEGRERKTEIKTFDNIQASKVAVANVKLYVDREEGFVGHGLKRSESEFVCDCSDIDNVIVIREDGVMQVTKISAKAFVGKGILYAGIWKKKDVRTVYNMIYRDGRQGNTYMKRFSVTSITRDKEYPLTKGNDGSKVLYLTVNPNGESEVVSVLLKSKPKLKKTKIDIDFAELAIKGRGAGGNMVTKNPVKRVEQKERGVSTLGARKIWFDDAVQRLNADGRGELLGEFSATDKILTITQSGHYQLYGFGLSTHFDEDMIIIEKWNPKKPVSAIYFEGEKQEYFVKRFLIDASSRKTSFITDNEKSQLEIVSTDWLPVVEVAYKTVKGFTRNSEQINLEEFIAIKGHKAIGNKLSPNKVKNIDLLDPIPFEEPPEETVENETIEEFEIPAADEIELEIESNGAEVTDKAPAKMEKKRQEREKLLKDKSKNQKTDTDSQQQIELEF